MSELWRINVVEDGTADVVSPFVRLNVIKEVPGKYWDSTRKVWVIPESEVLYLRDRVLSMGDRCVILPDPYEIGWMQRVAAERARWERDKAKQQEERAHWAEEKRKREEVRREMQEQLREDMRRRDAEYAAHQARMRAGRAFAYSPPSAASVPWAQQVLSRLTPEQGAKVYQKLASVLHPDVGGDAQLMVELNTARDRMRR